MFSLSTTSSDHCICRTSARSARRTKVAVVRGVCVVVAPPEDVDVCVWEALPPGFRCILVEVEVVTVDEREDSLLKVFYEDQAAVWRKQGAVCGVGTWYLGVLCDFMF